MRESSLKRYCDRSLKRQNLAGESFRNADIRSANFSDAVLSNADFTQARAGLSRRWIVIHSLVSLVTSILSGGIIGYYGNWCALYFNPNYLQEFSLLPGMGILALTSMSIAITTRRGSTIATVGIVAVISMIAGILTILLSTLIVGASFSRTIAIAVAVAVSGASTASNACLLSLCLAVAAAVSPILEGIAIALSVVTGMTVAVNGTGALTRAAIHPLAIGVTVGVIAFACYLRRKAMSEHPAFTNLRQAAIILSAIGGTSFRGADLSEANFTEAELNGSDFRTAIVKRTQWRNAKLRTARLGDTILRDAEVRQLLVTGQGSDRHYIGCNLEGANLEGADLRNVDFTASQLNEATFEAANLENANLSQIQALNTNFQFASFTGACLEAWNINNQTQLEGIDCRYVYLLNPQQARCPRSGEFAPNDFTQLFQIVANTIELIFHDDLDFQQLEATLKTVQAKYPDQSLTVKSIDKKAENLIVVEVKVSQGADKDAIYADLTQTYDRALQKIEECYQAELTAKENLLAAYRQFPLITLGRSRGKFVVLKLADGTISTGFSVILQIGAENMPPFAELRGKLPPAPELLKAYQRWKISYQKSLGTVTRLEIPEAQVTNINGQAFHQDCCEAANSLQRHINAWLNHPTFQSIREPLFQHLDRTEPIRLILQTDDRDLQRLPLQVWDFFDCYPHAELALSASVYQQVSGISSAISTLKILAILGDRTGINLQTDQQLLQQLLPTATIRFLDAPTRQELSDQLWSEQWNVLYFAGHSSTADAIDGKIQINPDEELTIAELRHALRNAIAQGLKLAIFNSCDGLGLAASLAELNLPQIIVMREPVPDPVAQAFLRNFLLAFSRGTTLYLSVREAREKLQGLEDRFPSAAWLPVIYQNPAEMPLSYHSNPVHY
ncbi:pentapeptide repeat-containing protein [Leptolyngbya sp. AN10]|uniref:pentapeptide repeat-containing protein n=1 Tax=Leptolyngbya sp. AN10 TaxID=3423365 RepID=UPI003D30FBD9